MSIKIKFANFQVSLLSPVCASQRSVHCIGLVGNAACVASVVLFHNFFDGVIVAALQSLLLVGCAVRLGGLPCVALIYR